MAYTVYTLKGAPAITSWLRPPGVKTVKTRGVTRWAKHRMRLVFLASCAKFAIACLTASRLLLDSFVHVGQCTAIPVHTLLRVNGLNRLDPGPGVWVIVKPRALTVALPDNAGHDCKLISRLSRLRLVFFIADAFFGGEIRLHGGSRTKYAGMWNVLGTRYTLKASLHFTKTIALTTSTPSCLRRHSAPNAACRKCRVRSEFGSSGEHRSIGVRLHTVVAYSSYTLLRSWHVFSSIQTGMCVRMSRPTASSIVVILELLHVTRCWHATGTVPTTVLRHANARRVSCVCWLWLTASWNALSKLRPIRKPAAAAFAENVVLDGSFTAGFLPPSATSSSLIKLVMPMQPFVDGFSTDCSWSSNEDMFFRVFVII